MGLQGMTETNLLFFTFFLICVLLQPTLSVRSTQWNSEHIEWQSYKSAMSSRSETGKPMFLLFHKSWCPACKALERHVAESMAIEVLSEHFLMVSILDDEDTGAKEYSPQGLYYPRILFAHSNGTVLKDVVNDQHHEPGHDHYFADADCIVTAMKKTLRQARGFTTFRGL